jgi:hypothetical protein
MVLNKGTLLPIGVAVAVALGLSSGAWNAATQLAGINARLDRIEAGLSQQWTTHDQLIWASQLSESNRASGLVVPPVIKSAPIR